MLFKLPPSSTGRLACETWGTWEILEEMPPEKLGGFPVSGVFFSKHVCFFIVMKSQ